MKEFIEKFRANAKRATLVQSRIKTLEKMSLVEEVLADPTCTFIFKTPEKIMPPLLKVEQGVFGYNKDEIVLKNLDFAIDQDSRLAIVGANGAGKSTLLNLMMGNLEIIKGNQYRNGKLRVSMFNQHHLETLDLELSPVDQIKKDWPGEPYEEYRKYLSSFGISGNLAINPSKLLSG